MNGTLCTGPYARYVVQEYCRHNWEAMSEMYKSRGSQDNQSSVNSPQIDVETNPDDHYSKIVKEWDLEWTIFVLAKFNDSTVLKGKKPILYQVCTKYFSA